MRGKGCRVCGSSFSVWGFAGREDPLPASVSAEWARPQSWGGRHICSDYLRPPRVETGEGQPSPTKSWGHTGCWEQVAMSPKGPWIYFILSNIEKHEEENSNSLNFPLLRINNYINILVYLLKHFLKEGYC